MPVRCFFPFCRLFLLFSAVVPIARGQPDYVTSREKILAELEPEKFRERMSGEVFRLPVIGSAHVAGRYFFTEKPFLIEGAEKLHEMGYPGLKLWLTTPRSAYPHHSDWSALGENPALVEMIRHPYYQAAIRLPFRVIALEVQEVMLPGEKRRAGHAVNPDSDFSADEAQVHALAAYLLREFQGREVTFILQNWEGDWMFRGGGREDWERNVYPDLELRTDAFIRWFSARQRGVERARAENPSSRARVLHAAEVNHVLAAWKGVPTLTDQVLPRVRVDLVSWSCYDGLRSWNKSAADTAVGIRQGIETIRHFAKRGPGGEPVPVMLGEMGIPERKGYDAASVAAVYDGALAACVSMKVPYVFLWELYCNEISEGVPKGLPSYREDQLNGFWLVKPDGGPGHGAEYFRRIMGPG